MEAMLISAVRAGDTDAVEHLLLAGADPDERDGAGTPVLCLAIESHAAPAARLLVEHGADPERHGPDGVRPLRKAVDSGSPALVEAVLSRADGGTPGEAELREARDLARHWYETGTEAELRRRTGAHGPVARTRVQDGEFDVVDELALGGATVRDGHPAILTDLDTRLGTVIPFDELRERALSRPDQEHAAWSASTMLLAHRRDQATWRAAKALRTHPDPAHRLFGAEVLRLTHLFDDRDEDPFAAPALRLFTDWAAVEKDPVVLAEVLVGLSEQPGPHVDAALLPHAGHDDARVRHAVAAGFDGHAPAFAPAVRDTLLALMTDPDPDVRRRACNTVASGKDRAPALADAMAALLDDPDRRVRVAAVHGLARHDDERCVEGDRRLPPAPPGTPYEYDLDEVWRYEMRRDGRR
ncbi:ankyrin repeat domain-containing protein [Streptomyces sp. NPDC126499]|uniref:ankyrin repeat domain-containing protein n=1 Tax=Streptomyces sp. NPDC126499 TaxID=3155314 RepID=UPI00332D18E9